MTEAGNTSICRIKSANHPYDVAFEDKHVGTDKDVYFINISISGRAEQDNYNLVTTFGMAKANVTPRSLTITANDITKRYGRTDNFTGRDDSRRTLFAFLLSSLIIIYC